MWQDAPCFSATIICPPDSFSSLISSLSSQCEGECRSIVLETGVGKACWLPCLPLSAEGVASVLRGMVTDMVGQSGRCYRWSRMHPESSFEERRVRIVRNWIVQPCEVGLSRRSSASEKSRGIMWACLRQKSLNRAASILFESRVEYNKRKKETRIHNILGKWWYLKLLFIQVNGGWPVGE